MSFNKFTIEKRQIHRGKGQSLPKQFPMFFSTIFDDAGHQQMDGKEGQRLLVVHWDCFRCATCGLDLGKLQYKKKCLNT
jgi:hypothetical protein